MSLLRQEYKKYITNKNDTINEAAFSWLKKNVVIINEKIDRTTVSRLIDNIQKFENTFGDFADKLPAIGRYLDSAEAGLQLVITGRANDKKASDMLKKLSILYFTFSDFFTRDLPVLLRTKMFKAAEEHPDVRLDMVGNMGNATAYNPNVVRDSLANALKPSKEEKKLLRKIYRSSLLPKLNSEEIAAQLMALTYEDLNKLTKVGKVPLVATDAEIEEGRDSLQADEKENLHEGLITEEALNEAANLLSEAKIEELQGQVNNLKKLVDDAGLDKLKNKVDKLQSDLLRAMNSDAFASYWEVLKQAKDKGGLGNQLKALFSQSPQSKEIANLLGRTNATIETFKAISSVWPKIQTTIDNKETLTSADVSNIKKMLISAAPKVRKGGILAKALNALVGGSSDDPYISADEIVDALVGDLEK